MRLTVKLSTAAEEGFVSMPALPEPGEAHSRADGNLDEAKARHDLSLCPNVLFSDHDDKPVIAFAVEIIDRLRIAFNRLMAEDPSARLNPGRHGAAARRFDKGRFAFVRIDIAHTSGRVRVRLSATNPREVVGCAEQFAKTYAQSVADNLVAIRDDLGAEGAAMHLVEGEGCEGVFAEAERRVERQRLAVMRLGCNNRINGFCTPIKPDCPLYRAGRCGEVGV